MTTHPPLYFIDSIDISSFRRAGIFEKARPLYESGHSLREIGKILNASKTAVRSALVRGGLILREQTSEVSRTTTAGIYYGLIRIHGQIVEDSKEQEVIQLIMKHWQDGMSFNSIADLLNRHKIKPRKAKQWHNATVRKIILRQIKLKKETT